MYGIPLILLVVLTKVKSQAAIGYFNQSSVVYLSSSWNVTWQTEFSFRTCTENGELLYQMGSTGDYLRLRLSNGSLQFAFRTLGVVSNIFIGSNLADNLWYKIEMSRVIGVNSLKISQASRTLFTKVLSNSTYNRHLLNVNIAGGARLTVGQTFVGCLSEGRGVLLSAAVESSNVLWNQCPLQEQAGCPQGRWKFPSVKNHFVHTKGR